MKRKNQEPPKEKKSSQDNYPEYLKYIGLAFQMFAVIGLGTWLGWKIQEKSQIKFPVWILLFCFLSIILAFYQIFKSLNNH
ncbi:AtpZ/AtpI family protein [Echinicola jeungdonensis]|uniref:AtpZ/AtpI family protein n=1 Tax=Echinicola jeungdonensis TaxID=709343 RepID=A0ABV5J1N8_9BACT|nr:AtpZ/AtpI family protein [Echinicola jeungdonensis]MDN3668572.1 AtpZ/AtpI family protein [Echinicola jeungdonensis]